MKKLKSFFIPENCISESEETQWRALHVILSPSRWTSCTAQRLLITSATYWLRPTTCRWSTIHHWLMTSIPVTTRVRTRTHSRTHKTWPTWRILSEGRSQYHKPHNTFPEDLKVTDSTMCQVKEAGSQNLLRLYYVLYWRGDSWHLTSDSTDHCTILRQYGLQLRVVKSK